MDPSYSRSINLFLNSLALQIKSKRPFEKSGTIYPVTQHITSQKTCIFKNTALRVSNLACLRMVKAVTPVTSYAFLTSAWKNSLLLPTIEYLIQLTAHVTRNICYFVMFFLHVSAPVGHLQGGHLQRNTFATNAAKNVLKWG